MYRLLLLLLTITVAGFVYTGIRKSLDNDPIRKKIVKSITFQIIFLSTVFFYFTIVFFADYNTIFTRDSLTSIAENKAAHIDDIFYSLEQDIVSMSVNNSYTNMFDISIDYRSRYDEALKQIKTSLSSHDDFINIMILSQDGYVIVDNQNKEGDYLAEDIAFVQGVKGSYLGDPYYNEVLGLKVMDLSTPIIVDNEIMGVLMVTYDISELEQITQDTIGLGKSGEVFLMTDAKYAITTLKKSPSKDIVPLGDTFCEHCSSISEEEELQLHTEDDYAGTKSAYTVVGLKSVDWFLIVQKNYMESLMPVFLIVLLELILLGVILILGRIGSKNISKSISDPIETLTENVESITKGNWNQKVELNVRDEIGVLSKDIDKLTAAILKSNKEVDKKVKKQTTELSEQKEKLNKQQLALLNILEDVALEKDHMTKERNKLDIILEGIGDGVFVIDTQYNITRFNSVATDISGFKSEEVIGKNCKDVLVFRREKDDSLHYEFLDEALEQGVIKSMENHTYLERKDGSHIQVADSAAPIFDESGKISGVVVVFRDVTKDREINKMKDEFVSVASHQLRTPLTGIKWYLQLLTKEKEGKLNSTQRNYIKSIYDSNERMIKLVDDLLSVSRIDTGRKFNVKKKKTNIVSTVKNIINVQSVIARRRGVEVICQKNCPTELTVNVDEDKISEVFANIISNAVKYSKDNGKVNISVKEKDDAYIFAIKDRGLGIPKPEQEKIFQKFFRAENVKKHQVGGNGLGLYIAKSIIDAHDGDLWFESKEGKGTTFYIKINKA